MTSIPLDLIGDIVDHLQYDRESLKACSLVAVSFCSTSQRHLFSTMWLKCHDWDPRRISSAPPYSGEKRTPTSTIQKISVLFAEFPHLATYVRHLTAELFFSFKFTDGEMQLDNILRGTRNLETFALAGGPIRWHSLSTQLGSTILDVIAQPSLRRLHLWSMQDVPAAVIFDALASMAVLSIFNTSVQPEDSISTRKDTSRLQQLILSNANDSVHAFILSPWAPDLVNVTRLLIAVGRGTDLGSTECLLTSLSGTLTHLILDCKGEDFSDGFPIPHLPHLRSLTLKLFRGFSQSFIPEGFAIALPELFASTLVRLPPAALTLLFSNGRFSLEEPRIEHTAIPGLTSHITGLGGAKPIDAKTIIHCQLHMDQPDEADFNAFGVAMRMAFPQFQLELSIVEEGRASFGDGL